MSKKCFNDVEPRLLLLKTARAIPAVGAELRFQLCFTVEMKLEN